MGRLKVCLAGFGYWGTKLARNITASKTFELRYVMEPDPSKHVQIKLLYPFVEILKSSTELLSLRDAVDVGFIATPTSTHLEMALIFLELDCHIWVEKPFALTYSDAEQIVDLYNKKNLKVFVDHTFLYTSAVRRIKEEIVNILPLTYINSTRANFGIIQNDSSVIWDLAVHDLAILGFLTEIAPVSIAAKASSPFPHIMPSVATILIDYGQFFATIHVNWLSPFKIRDFFIGGTKGSMHFDDTETEDKLRLYSQSIESLLAYDQSNIRQFDYKYGEVRIPDIENSEALVNAVQSFSDYILTGTESPSSGCKALEVIRILAAADQSLKGDGMQVLL